MHPFESDGERLRRNIRREMGGEMMNRFSRSLAPFQAAETLPAPFADLLARLDGAASDKGGWVRCC